MSIITEAKRIEAAKAELKIAIEEKGVTVGDGTIDTYPDKVREITAGGSGDITQNPLYYMNIIDNQWRYAAFPEGFDFVLCLKTLPSNMNSLLMNTTGIKTATLSCDVNGVTNFSGLIRGSTVEMLDISNFKPIPSNINYFALGNTRIAQIKGELDLSSCTTANTSFNGTTALQEIRFKEGTISIALSFENCSLLTDDSVQSIIDGLADLTGGTAQTLEFHSSVTAKLTDEQYSQIFAKNWTTK